MYYLEISGMGKAKEVVGFHTRKERTEFYLKRIEFDPDAQIISSDDKRIRALYYENRDTRKDRFVPVYDPDKKEFVPICINSVRRYLKEA